MQHIGNLALLSETAVTIAIRMNIL